MSRNDIMGQIVTGLIICIIAVGFILAVKKILKDRKKGSCCGSCNGCTMDDKCNNDKMKG